MSDFAKVDFSQREVAESLARAYAVAIRIKQPAEGIKENPASYGILGEPEKPKRKPKKEKPQPQAEQLRLF